MGVIVVAAGSGTRLAAGLPKALVEIHGASILQRALDVVVPWAPEAVIVVAPRSHLAQAQTIAGLSSGRPGTQVQVVAGGAERSDSVAAGLQALRQMVGDLRIVLVHDAARCFAPAEVFDRVRDAVRDGAAGAVPGLPVVDTIKQVDEVGTVIGTPSRAGLRRVQTPQAFDAQVLGRAHADFGGGATDDATMVEALGERVVVVEGDARALKITEPDDLRAVAAWAETH